MVSGTACPFAVREDGASGDEEGEGVDGMADRVAGTAVEEAAIEADAVEEHAAVLAAAHDGAFWL